MKPGKLVALLLIPVMLVVVAFSSLSVFMSSTAISVSESVLYKVKPGTGFNQFCRDLVSRRYIEWCGPLKWYTKFHPSLRQLKKGTYRLTSDMTLVDVLAKVTSGKEHQFSITFVEGDNYWQILERLKNAPHLIHDITLQTDPDIVAAVKASEAHPEGIIFPDTYSYLADSKESDILRRAYQRMTRVLEKNWTERATGLPYETPYQALIMASIIEKETGVANERPLIASVFVNRLDVGMRLQTDPTVIYGLGKAFDGDLKRSHLKQKTPYNTYRIKGLPPTPIAMPGEAAISAALNPAISDYFYFVAKGDGSHQFSATLNEHNKAVREYQLKRSQR